MSGIDVFIDKWMIFQLLCHKISTAIKSAAIYEVVTPTTLPVYNAESIIIIIININDDTSLRFPHIYLRIKCY